MRSHSYHQWDVNSIHIKGTTILKTDLSYEMRLIFEFLNQVQLKWWKPREKAHITQNKSYHANLPCKIFLLSPTWSDPTTITLQPLHLLPTCSSIKSTAFYAVLFLSFLTIHLRLESNNAKYYRKVISDKNHPLNSMICPNRNSCSLRSRRQAVCTRMPHHKNFEFAFPQLCFLMS